ncbi:hypothetical protein ACFVYD_07775 [Streptomyces sp. NPDC058301]|uniref:AraC-like ligand-binding domain-containing protein n=1 Tax=Streptomyces sp. NPDC058301 TaxID=3346436 RepID=UPI0036ED0FF0
MRCGTDVHMRFGDLGAYHVDIPLSGELVRRQSTRRPATANARRAAVFHPVGEPTLERWNRGCRLLAVKICAQDLLRHLEVLLDHSVPTAMRLAPELDICDVRMTRVHAELRQADPAQLAVGEAAYRWGLTHLGRFADSYRTRVGELPSRTLGTP